MAKKTSKDSSTLEDQSSDIQEKDEMDLSDLEIDNDTFPLSRVQATSPSPTCAAAVLREPAGLSVAARVRRACPNAA